MVGSELPFNAEYFYRKAFSALGHEVYLVNSYADIGHPLISRLIHSRTTVFNFTLRYLWINNNLLKKVEEIDPDVIIIFKGDMISTDVLSELSQNWDIYLFYPDTFKFKPLLKNRLGYFRAVFTASNNKQFYYELGARKAVTVPWACDPDFHRKIDTEKKYKVSFVGTAYPERRRIVRNIQGVNVFGDFWFGFGKLSHPPVYGNEFVKTINQTDINLNIQAKVSIQADAPTMRTFEVAGCGGFQISDYMPSIRRYFPMLPTFHSITELKELIHYFSDNCSEAIDIGYKTMEICHSSYKYVDAARMILSSL